MAQIRSSNLQQSMIAKISRSLSKLAFSVFLCVSFCQNGITLGDLATFELQATNQVSLGQQVNWILTVSVSGFQTPANNHGIDSVAVDLNNTGNDALTAGVIGPGFADYSASSGGTVSGASLIEIGALQFIQNNAIVEARDPVIGGAYTAGTPILLASGSFTPTAIGTFNLDITAGSTNSFFTAAGSNTGTGQNFDVVFISDTYNVVPEPSGLAFVGLTSLVCSARRKRRS